MKAVQPLAVCRIRYAAHNRRKTDAHAFGEATHVRFERTQHARGQQLSLLHPAASRKIDYLSSQRGGSFTPDVSRHWAAFRI